jgi:hypothetical protein
MDRPGALENLKRKDYWGGVWRVALVILGIWVIFELTRRVYVEHRRAQAQTVVSRNILGGVKVPTNFLGCWGPEAVWGTNPDFVDIIQYAPTGYELDTGGVSYTNIARWARNRNKKFRPGGDFLRYIAIALLPIAQTGSSLQQIPGVAFAFNELGTNHKQGALSCTLPCQGAIDSDEWNVISDGTNFYWRPGVGDVGYFCGLLNGQCSTPYACDSTTLGPIQMNPYKASFAVYRTPNIV